MLWRSVVALVVAALCPVVAAQTFPASPAKGAPEQLPEVDPQFADERGLTSVDECTGAAVLTCGAVIVADTATATTSASDPLFPCRFGAPGQGAGSVWFRYVAPGLNATFETTYSSGLPAGTLPDTLLAVYAGGCDGLVQIACNDDIDVGASNLLSRITLSDLVPGQTYYIEVAAWNNATRAVYNLSVSGCAAINDSCATPLSISCGESVTAFCSAATTSPDDPTFSCRVGSGCVPGSAPSQGAASVWFSFVAPSARVTISTDATGGGDSILAVYSGGCGNLTAVACHDDIDCAGGNFRSRIVIDTLIPGETYLIEVAAWSLGARRDFTLTVECAVSNDSCASPIPLFCGQPEVASLAAATTSPTDPIFDCRVLGLGANGCNPGTSPSVGAGSVWYSFTAPSTRAVIETGPFGSSFISPDTILQVFSESSTCGALTPIACNDDVDCPNRIFTSRVELTALIPGETYLIELAAWNSGARRDYTIRVDCLCPEPNPCPAGALIEPELCGENVNGGCYQDTTGKTPTDLGVVICGVAPYPDFDIYTFSINRPTNVAFRVQGESPFQFALLCDTCAINNVIGDAINVGCDQGVGPVFLAPGNYDAGLINTTNALCENADYLAAVYPVPVCRGDANADGVVDFLDITTILANFGTSYNPFPGTGFGDSDSNGNVEFLDVTTTLAAFGINCTPMSESCATPATRGGLSFPR